MAELALTSFVQKNTALRRALGPVLFLLCFFLFLALTFPFEELARRIEGAAHDQGLELTIGRLGAGGLTTLRAHDVKVRMAADAPVELTLDRVDVSPELLALLTGKVGFSFSAQLYGGEAHGKARLSKDPKVPGLTALTLDAKDIDLKALPLQQAAGVQALGLLALKVDLPSLQPTETASGNVALTLSGAAIAQGAVMGMTLPRTSLGNLEGTLTVDKGVAKVDKLQARGGDIDLEGEGTIRLRPLLSLSQADLKVKVRPQDRWLDANPMIKGGIGLLGPKQGDGWWFTLTGPLSRLNGRPGR